MQVITVHSPIGNLSLTLENEHCVHLSLFGNPTKSAFANHPFVEQLVQYFQGQNRHFNVSLQLRGTAFQQRVWQALQAIPYGQTRRYGEIAEQLNSSARAVGNACRANPVPIFVPCHRVVAKSGIGGFSGATEGEKLDVKQWLLAHERHHYR